MGTFLGNHRKAYLARNAVHIVIYAKGCVENKEDFISWETRSIKKPRQPGIFMEIIMNLFHLNTIVCVSLNIFSVEIAVHG